MSTLPDFPFAKQSTFTRNGDLGDHPTVESPLPVTESPAAESQVTNQQILPSLGEHAVDPLPLTDSQNTVQNTEPSEDNLDNVTTPLERRYPLRNRKPKIIQSMTSMDFGEQSSEQSSFREAMESREAFLWQPSIQEEYDSHIRNGTWKLVPLPADRTPIGTRWVFKVKPGHLETPTRYKSRFVAKGYSQVKGIDFNEYALYAPVVGYTSLRVILSLCAIFDLEMAQLDIKTAFLNGLVEEEIYIEQPEGFTTPESEHLVGRLVKCIYGLKQALHVWNEKFNDFLILFGFTRSKHDPCVYFRRRETEILIMAIWVDDGLICSNNKTAIAEIISFLATHFEMRSLPTDRFVGLELTRNRKEKKLWVNQQAFIEKIIHRFNMSQCNPKLTPADPNVRLSKEMEPKTNSQRQEAKKLPYQQAVGCLNYLAQTTRPDIGFAVNQLSRYCNLFGAEHWKAAKHVIAYLKGTVSYGLCYGGDGASVSSSLVGYSDSDYAGDLDNFRSTTGYILFFNLGPVCWRSRLQPSTAGSTMQAEYQALSDFTKETVFVRWLLQELNFLGQQPAMLFCDNTAAIQLANNPSCQAKTRHINVAYHTIRDFIKDRSIEVNQVSSKENLADTLTKPLPAVAFEKIRSLIGIQQLLLSP